MSADPTEYLAALGEQRAELRLLYTHEPHLPAAGRFKLTERERTAGISHVAEFRRLIDRNRDQRSWAPQ